MKDRNFLTDIIVIYLFAWGTTAVIDHWALHMVSFNVGACFGMVFFKVIEWTKVKKKKPYNINEDQEKG